MQLRLKSFASCRLQQCKRLAAGLMCFNKKPTTQNETGHRNKPPTPLLQWNTMQERKKTLPNMLPSWVFMGSATRSVTLKVGASQLQGRTFPSSVVIFLRAVNETLQVLVRGLQSNKSSECVSGETRTHHQPPTHPPTHPHAHTHTHNTKI